MFGAIAVTTLFLSPFPAIRFQFIFLLDFFMSNELEWTRSEWEMFKYPLHQIDDQTINIINCVCRRIFCVHSSSDFVKLDAARASVVLVKIPSEKQEFLKEGKAAVEFSDF